MWLPGVLVLVLAHQNVVSAKTFMTSEISMPFDGHKKTQSQEDVPTILWNQDSRPSRIRSSRFERLKGAEIQPINIRPAIVEVSEPSSIPMEIVPVAPEFSNGEVRMPQQQVLPSEIPPSELPPAQEIMPSRAIVKEIVLPKTLHAQEVKPAKIREYSTSEVAASNFQEVKPTEHWEHETPELLPPVEFGSEVVSSEFETQEEAVTVPTIPMDYAKLPETGVQKPIRRVHPIVERSSKFAQETTEEPTTSTTTTPKPKKLKKKKRKNRKSRTTTMVTIPITTTLAPTTSTTSVPTTTTEEPQTTKTTTTTTTMTTPPSSPIQIHTLPISKHGESYLGGWNEEVIKKDESLGNIMNQLSEVPSSISLTDENAVRAYYQKYYEEWYRQHNIAMPSPEPGMPSTEPEIVTPSTTPHKKISIQLGSRNQPHPSENGDTSSSSAASNQFGIPSNATAPSKEQLEKICDYVAKISKSFGIKDPVMFAKNNCAFVKNFHPQATCEQVQEVMAYCATRVYSTES